MLQLKLLFFVLTRKQTWKERRRLVCFFYLWEK